MRRPQADFCNPGLLGKYYRAINSKVADLFARLEDDYSTFKKVFENPIKKSREPGCSKKELELGEARSAQVFPSFPVTGGAAEPYLSI